MKLYIILLLCLFFTSCKDKLAETQELVIGITFKIVEDDEIKLYYVLEEKGTFNETDSKQVQVNGLTEFQNVDFILPGTPKRFRIDLGEKGNETPFYISSVTLVQKKKIIKINESQINRFFKANIYATRFEKGYERKEVLSRYDPFIESTALLSKKMELIFK